jgi:endonuclease/exonuclease/phosphatase family metal-dependent hydrolase
MGKLAVYKYFSFIFLITTIIVAGFTFFGLFGGNVPPAGNTARAMLVYILPLLIIANAVLLLYWLIRRRWHWAAIPLVTLLCCIPYIGTIFQFGSSDEAADKKSGLKIATYNVARFIRETTGFIAQDILAQMRKQKVDVFCIQEYNEVSGDKKNSESYKDYFPHSASHKDMVIYSRYPIVNQKNIDFDQTNNSAMWAEVNVNDNVYRIYNVHMETTGINSTLHKAAKMANKGVEVQGNALINAIYGSYTIGMIARSGQANMIAMDMMESKVPIIVCGDFNDVPYSYVYNTMLGDKIDGFKECGSGFMYTYRGGKKKVRIDYIFHDKELKGLSYYKKELSYSDHYPVFMRVATTK